MIISCIYHHNSLYISWPTYPTVSGPHRCCGWRRFQQRLRSRQFRGGRGDAWGCGVGDITRSRHSVGDGTSRAIYIYIIYIYYMFVYIYIVGIKLQDIAIICYNYIVLYIMLYYILCCLSQDITRLYTININKHRSISDISDECWNRGPNFECLQHLALLLCHQHCGIATWSEPRPQHFGIIGFSAKTMPTWCSCLRLRRFNDKGYWQPRSWMLL